MEGGFFFFTDFLSTIYEIPCFHRTHNIVRLSVCEDLMGTHGCGSNCSPWKITNRRGGTGIIGGLIAAHERYGQKGYKHERTRV